MTKNALGIESDDLELEMDTPPSLVTSLKIGETMIDDNIVVIATLENDEQRLLFLNDRGAFVLATLLEQKLAARNATEKKETN